MKRVSKTYWAVVSDGDLVEGDVDGVLITDSKRTANAWVKEMEAENEGVEFRVARLKMTETVPKNVKA